MNDSQRQAQPLQPEVQMFAMFVPLFHLHFWSAQPGTFLCDFHSLLMYLDLAITTSAAGGNSDGNARAPEYQE